MVKKPQVKRSTGAAKGTLIIVGGAEDKMRDRIILKEIAQRTGNGRLMIVTAASGEARLAWEVYEKIFHHLGIKHVSHLHIETAEEARDISCLKLFRGVKTVFFTGGDQLRITTKLGGTPVLDCIQSIYKKGGLIAGTSAGAAVMGKIMIIGGSSVQTHKVGNWLMAPGLGFLEEMIIDQHFAQRGRISRLLGAVGLNPGLLGLGIDEDTAIVVHKNRFQVIGQNAVYVVDGRGVSYTNFADSETGHTMSLHDVCLHVLAAPEVFDLKTRSAPAKAA